MKKFVFTAVALFFLSTSAYAATKGGNMTYLYGIRTKDNLNLVWEIPTAQLKNLPQWFPEQGPPPLPLKDALDIAHAKALSRHIKFDDLKASEISLSTVFIPEPEGIWFYVIQFMPVVDGFKLFGGGGWEVVLMNGEIVEATGR